jgi:plasmid stabilization system protein ParE
MAYRVETSLSALNDADEAYQWLHRQSPQAAVRWLNGLEETIQTLSNNPQRCSLAPESDEMKEEIRQLLYGKRRNVYRILFRIRGDLVTVLYIRHAARRYRGT